MKLTKFAHSCVLVEDQGMTVLFDPGTFSWNSGSVDMGSLPEVHKIIVSHRHPDHCAEPFVRALVQQFPDAVWFAPDDAEADLMAWGVSQVMRQSSGNVQVAQVNHAPVEPFGVQVQNLVTNLSGRVTHPGDTHDFVEAGDVLLLPVQAPWGTTIRAIELVQNLKPKYVLPIHDWMWNEEWRQNCYDRFEQIFAGTDTKFLRPVDGQAIEVQL